MPLAKMEKRLIEFTVSRFFLIRKSKKQYNGKIKI